MNRNPFEDVTDNVITYLRFLAENGCIGFECSENTLEKVKQWGRRERKFANPKSKIKNQKSETLETIRLEMVNCRRCKLAEKRNHIVFGEGDHKAKLVFVGEAPGNVEDKSGIPFVGEAGYLLTKIITNALHLTREEVYICNIIKCRPPGNRNPEPDEISACLPFLKRQIAVIRPQFICALGTFAAQTLLSTTTPISALRGRFYDYMGIRLLPLFHPAYLLRNPDKKRETWEDIKKLIKEMKN